LKTRWLVLAFGEHAAGVGIGVVGVNLVIASLIVLIRRFVFTPTRHKLLWSIITIILGCLVLLSTSGVLAYAYHVVGATKIPSKVGG